MTDKQEHFDEQAGIVSVKPAPRFNWALFLGCCVVALSIVSAGHTIANRIPHTLMGSLTGTLASGTGAAVSQDFLSHWEAPSFLRMEPSDFDDLLESGALEGTYASFQTYRTVIIRSDINTVPGAPTPAPRVFYSSDAAVLDSWMVERAGLGEGALFETETIIYNHRVFSRERLTEWLHNRMEGGH